MPSIRAGLSTRGPAPFRTAADLTAWLDQLIAALRPGESHHGLPVLRAAQVAGYIEEFAAGG